MSKLLTLRLTAVFNLFIFMMLSSNALASVTKVNGHLHRAEANLASVNASIGHRTTPPKGSAAKLSAMRLQQVLDDLTPAKTLLEQIPAGTEGLTEASARYKEASDLYNKLRVILTGTNTPVTIQNSGGAKLGYQQQEQLRNARFHANEVEANAKTLTERLQQLQLVKDQLSINYREVNQLLSLVENAQRKSNFAKDALSTLPENGQGVSQVIQQIQTADSQVIAAVNFLRPLQSELSNIINPANYPDFESEQRRLRELSAMFARPEILQTQRELAADTFKQSDAAKQERDRIINKYSRLIQQETPQGETLKVYGNNFLKNHAAFLSYAEEMKKVMPNEIRSHLEQAKKYADEAVANQKPAWFNGGIPQQMGFAKDQLALLEVIAPEQGNKLRKEVEATEQTLDMQAESLRELIIRENEMPSDRFQGDDRQKAIETAISGWRVQQNDFEILKVRIPSENWARETKWTYSNGTWYYSDRSRLQVRLIIEDKENPKLAIDRPINVIKDHQKGDSMIGVPFWSYDDELPPSSFMLRSKVK